MTGYQRVAVFAGTAGIGVVSVVLIVACYVSVVFADWQLREVELSEQSQFQPVIVAWCGTVSTIDDYSSNAEAIFKANCASCHKLTESRGTGPGLILAGLRWENNRDELTAFIRMGAKRYLESNGKFSQRIHQLIEEYGTIMPPQQISDADARGLAELICQLN